MPTKTLKESQFNNFGNKQKNTVYFVTIKLIKDWYIVLDKKTKYIVMTLKSKGGLFDSISRTKKSFDSKNEAEIYYKNQIKKNKIKLNLK